MHWMERRNIDILALQETYFNTNSKMKRGKFTFFFSTKQTLQTKTEKTQPNIKKGKEKGNTTQKMETKLIKKDME